MALEDINGTNSSASVRLMKLTFTPGAQELNKALEQARKTTSAVIELPWRAASSPATYVLKVSMSDSTAEATWMLHKGDTVDAAVLWSFDSDDTSLIESLIAAECGDPGRSFTESQEAAPEATPVSAGDSQVKPEPAPVASGRELPSPVMLNQEIASGVRKRFLNPDTGIFTQEASLYFVLSEVERYEHLRTPLALLIVELKANYGDGAMKSLPERALQEAMKRFNDTIRGIDILGHFDVDQFALVLPGSGSNDAVECCKRLEKCLLEGPLQPGLDVSSIHFCAGAASIPDTCQTAGHLVATAQDALRQAIEGKSAMVLFPSS